jgi:hypothetical protein
MRSNNWFCPKLEPQVNLKQTRRLGSSAGLYVLVKYRRVVDAQFELCSGKANKAKSNFCKIRHKTSVAKISTLIHNCFVKGFHHDSLVIQQRVDRLLQ